MVNNVEITLDTDKSSDKEEASKKISSVNTQSLKNIEIVGKITQQIGTGDNAKHSIIWTTIRWCFVIASVITGIIFVFLGYSYASDRCGEIDDLKKFILTVWSVFTPIITLALGYAFGKDYK